MQCALACICYRLLDFITAEWADLAPDVLGRLLPIIRELPPGRTLAVCYPSGVEEEEEEEEARSRSPSAALLLQVPDLLREVFAVRAELRETWHVPRECANSVLSYMEELGEAREQYRRVYTAPRVVRDAARNKFLAAYGASHAAVIDAELSLLERQAAWDRLVRLLRGAPFYANEFDFDSEQYDGAERIFRDALPLAIRNRPL